ncbi:MAG: hypothetical protein GC164_11530 [Phycisphaera sp.]|nr:hypothetical protein [Phycisphaera sp.]
MKLTGAAILLSRGIKVLQAAPAAYPYRYPARPMALHRNDIADVRTRAIAIVQELAASLDRAPTQNEYKQHVSATDAPSISQVLYQFGTWTELLTQASIEPNNNMPPDNGYSVQDVIDEFIDVANSLGRLPTQAEFTQHSKYSVRPYTSRWGKWSQVKIHFAQTHANSLKFQVPATDPTEPVGATRRPPLPDDLPLRYQPRNEMETIVLFALLAKELGYKIRLVRADFPDAELERDGEIVMAEFEYESANYIQHGHPLDADCICICWRHTRDLGSVKVLALEDVLRERRDNQRLQLTGDARER